MFIPHSLWIFRLFTRRSGHYQMHYRSIRRNGARLQRPIALGIDVPLAFQGVAGGNEVQHLNQTE